MKSREGYPLLIKLLTGEPLFSVGSKKKTLKRMCRIKVAVAAELNQHSADSQSSDINTGVLLGVLNLLEGVIDQSNEVEIKDEEIETLAALLHSHWQQRLSVIFAAAKQVLEYGIGRAYLIDGELREELQRHIVSTWGALSEGEWKDITREDAKDCLRHLTANLHGNQQKSNNHKWDGLTCTVCTVRKSTGNKLPRCPWWTNHLPSCGTRYRGCDPACPQEQYERELADA